MTKAYSILFTTLLLSTNSVAYNCFPENDVKIPVKRKFSFLMKSAKKVGLNEMDFHKVIDTFEGVWKPIVEKKYGKKLIIKREWKGERVNASATRDDDNNPMIIVNGGLARHHEMTTDGLMLILCHELGHHYGGAPKSLRGRSTKRSWSSAEGQADYFASSKCMPRMVLEGKAFANTEIGNFENSPCKDSLCQKILPAALSVGRLFASLKYDWQVPTPGSKSSEVVWETNYRHPTPQCRFDTFVAGSLCSNDYDIDFDNADYKVGACLGYDDASKSRPRCWFSPEQY